MAMKQDFQALYFRAAFCLTSENISDFTPVSRRLGVDVSAGMGTVFTALGARYDMRYVAQEGFLTTDSYEVDTRSVDNVPVSEVMRYTRGQTIREDAVPDKYKKFVDTVKEGKSVFTDYNEYKAGDEEGSVLFLISPAAKDPKKSAEDFLKVAEKIGKNAYATNAYNDCGYLMIQLEMFDELEKVTDKLNDAIEKYSKIVTDDQFVLDALLVQFADKADKIMFIDEFIYENKDKLEIAETGKKITIHESGIVNRLYPGRKLDYAEILNAAGIVYAKRSGYDVSDSGIAGGLGFADTEVMKAVAERRVKDLKALKADVIISVCAAEKVGLEIGGAENVESLLSYVAAL